MKSERFITDHVVLPFAKYHAARVACYAAVVLLTYGVGSIALPRAFSAFMSAAAIGSEQMRRTIALIALLAVAFMLSYYAKNYMQHRLLLDISSSVRYKSLKSLLNGLVGEYKEIEESEFTYISTVCYFTSRHIIKFAVEHVVPYVAIFLLVAAYFTTHAVALATILALHFVAINCYIWNMYGRLTAKATAQESIWIGAGNRLGDQVKNLMNIIFDNNVSNELKSLKDTQRRVNVASLRYYDAQNRVMLGGFVINYAMVVCVIAVLYWQFKKGQMVKEQLTSILMILLIYQSVLQTYVSEAVGISHAVSKISVVDRHIASLLSDTDACDVKFPSQFYSVRFDAVSFAYSKKHRSIIENRSFHFRPKQLNVLRGPSGSGKTTIMKLIVKMIKPTSGKIYYDSAESSRYCAKDVRTSVYYVNQRTTLFNRSVMYNLQYGNSVSAGRIVSLLLKYDLMTPFAALPNGLNSFVGVNGSQLSLGMQKIVMVMRGVLKPNKTVVIFDEPLTSLDPGTQKKIIKLLTSEMTDKTVVVISHDEAILPYADHVVDM
jgi:ABC-type multidrug transport system fused ATPase/permease subunit